MTPDSTGLSPRGRGNPQSIVLSRTTSRSIPAWAGEPSYAYSQRRRAGVYPRVGGGTADSQYILGPPYGLSPRGRGNPEVLFPPPTPPGSIPAWAGEPDAEGVSLCTGWVYPRVGGGTLRDQRLAALNKGPSPRGRGNRVERLQSRHPSAVYPRVGGGTASPSVDRLVHPSRGLSPRGRGRPCVTGFHRHTSAV